MEATQTWRTQPGRGVILTRMQPQKQTQIGGRGSPGVRPQHTPSQGYTLHRGEVLCEVHRGVSHTPSKTWGWRKNPGQAEKQNEMPWVVPLNHTWVWYMSPEGWCRPNSLAGTTVESNPIMTGAFPYGGLLGSTRIQASWGIWGKQMKGWQRLQGH